MDRHETVWFRLTVKMQPDIKEIIERICWEAGCIGVLERVSQDEIFFQTRDRIDQAVERLEKLVTGIEYHVDQVKDTGWRDAWHQFFKPAPAADSFVVLKPGDRHVFKSRIPLYIYPGQAFGTGRHETTELLLKMLDRYDMAGKSVLDVGCGSGILCFAALMKGAVDAVGLDIDPVALEEAEKNAGFNFLRERCRWIAGTPETLSSKTRYDVVFANINRNTLLRYRTYLINGTAASGLLCLSGFLKQDAQYLKQAFTSDILVVQEEDAMGEWYALFFRKDSDV